MTAPERFSVLASLPPHGSFRRALALDRGGVARAVVLAFVPQAVTDDPVRLAAVLRDVEAAARLHHPGAAAVLGTETVGSELAIVELHRPGVTVRALLDGGGRLPPDVASRIAIDACAALAQAHAIDAGDGRRLAHGALDAARIVVGQDGAAFVCGLALGGGGDTASDLRALGSILFESIAGEVPGAPPRRLDVPGVPPTLAEAVDRATGAAGAPFESAAALAAALAAATPPAPHAAVAAYTEAMLPHVEAERADPAPVTAGPSGGSGAEQVPEELTVDASRSTAEAPAPRPAAPVATPTAAAMPAAAPTATPTAAASATPTAATSATPAAAAIAMPAAAATATPAADVAGTFPKPAPLARRSRMALGVVAICLGAGFVIGLWLSRAPDMTFTFRWSSRPPGSDATAAPAPTATPAPSATATSAPSASSTPAHAPIAGANRAAPSRPPTLAKARVPTGTGKLDVTAPDDAEIFVDGKRVGRGSVLAEIPEGSHRVEVRRAGAAVSERFMVLPGETWTYTVTPAP